MSRLIRRVTMLLLLAGAGCTTATAPGLEGLEEVAGTLVSRQDDTPVDGGIVLTVTLGGGAPDTLLIPSLFRPDVTDDDLALVRKAREAEIGRRLWAVGERIDGGLRVVDLYLSEEEFRRR